MPVGNVNCKIMKLSILICSLNRRKHFLDKLLSKLEAQQNDQVELITSIDDGELSIGAKRQKLLEDSNGEYIVFIDDDDDVSEDYVQKILSAIKSEPDVVGIHLIMNHDGHLSGKTYHSIKYKNWYDAPSENPQWRYYYRNPNHLNPVKRNLALQVGFKDISNGEDRDYSMRLLPLLATEEYIKSAIYFYNVRTIKDC